MSFEAAAWAIKQSPRLPTEKLILIALADCHNRDTGRCDPSLLTLAEVAMCSDRTAMRSIESLENQGLISTKKELGKRTKYRLKIIATPDARVTPDKMSPVTSVTPTPDTHVTSPLTPMSPEPVSISKKPVNKYSEKDYSLAEWIYELVLIVAPKTKKPNLNKWANTVRLMIGADGNTHREIAEVFKWANSDNFWKTNICSPDKLRKQFATLHAQANNHEKNQRFSQSRRPSVVDRVHAAAAEREQVRQAEEREIMGSIVGEATRDIRPSATQPVRRNNTGELGEIIDGDYTRTD